MTNVEGKPEEAKETPRYTKPPIDNPDPKPGKVSIESKLILFIAGSIAASYLMGKHSGYRKGLTKGALMAYSDIFHSIS